MTQPAANPFEVLGLPDTWQPVPVKYRCGRVEALTGRGPVTYHTLIVDGPMGRTAIAFEPDDLRAFIDMLEGQLSPLHVPRIVPPDGIVPI